MQFTGKLAPHEMFEYLVSIGFNLTTDRIFRDQFPSPEIIWNIIFTLCQPLRDDRFKQLLPTLSHILDPEDHFNSLKKMEQYIIISSTLKKLQFEKFFEIEEVLKPQKEKINDKISCLIQAFRIRERLLKENDQIIMENKQTIMAIKEASYVLEEIEDEVEAAQKQKDSQKAQYEEKKRQIDEILNQISYKRREKADLMTSEEELNAERSKRQQIKDTKDIVLKEKQMEIKRLEKMQIDNGPALKRQKIQLVEHYEQLKKKHEKEERQAEKDEFGQFILEDELKEIELLQKSDGNKDIIEQFLLDLKEIQAHRSKIEQQDQRIKNLNEKSIQLSKQNAEVYNQQASLEVNVNQAVSKSKTESDKMKEQQQINEKLEETVNKHSETYQKLITKSEEVEKMFNEEYQRIQNSIEELKRKADLIEEEAIQEFKDP